MISSEKCVMGVSTESYSILPIWQTRKTDGDNTTMARWILAMFYRQYGQRCLRYRLRDCGNPADPDDIVNYKFEIVSPRLFPLASMIGLDDTMIISNSTAVRNQPFGAQVDLVATCVSELN